MQVQGGTLLIQDVEKLTVANQYRLYQLIRFHVCHGVEIGSLRKLDVRVMVTVGEPLAKLRAGGKLREDLYYLLSGLELRVPSLRERKEDLQLMLEETIRDCCERYSRYHVLTSGARESLMDYGWPGNLFQVESFCERLILTVGKRSVDEIMVRKLLAELYPEEVYPVERRMTEQHSEMMDSVRCAAGMECEEGKKIAEALVKHGGSREKTAKELGISKVTLWRHMKKYGIEMKCEMK